jgi:small subunit ribosomal protein S9
MATIKKKTIKKTAKKPAKKETKAKRYFEAVGRRKRAVARARLFTCQPFEGEEAKIIVNGKPYQKFFTSPRFSQMAASPLQRMKSVNRFEATVKVKGGGMASQAEATRHGLSRALVKFNPEFSKKLKRAGFLTRDSREVERKKPGLKKARRAAQWRKR